MRSRSVPIAIATAVIAGGVLIAAGCGSDDDDSSTASSVGEGVSVTIADKGFTESFIVANAYAQALDAQGFDTEVTSLASTEIADGAITGGEIDIYPEYTGTTYLNVLMEAPEDAPESREEQFTFIQEASAERGLTALEPAPYNNGNEVACTQESGITTLEELAEQAGDITYSANAEHLTRPDGLPLLQEEYGIEFGDIKTVDISLRYQPIEDGDAQCVYAFGTDPAIAEQELVVLEDEQGLFTGGVSFQIYPVVNTEWFDGLTGEQQSAIEDSLAAVDEALEADVIRAANAQVDFDNEDPEDVANEVLTDAGLL
jgi:osmoprotectant transport system substrate-binding protein